MNNDLETEIFELMEKYDIDYDQALERHHKRQEMLELAHDRAKAHEIQKEVTHKKQRKIQNLLHPDLFSDNSSDDYSNISNHD